MKKIYFAGSIRGGRADAELYRRLIDHINENNAVLTEHVGCLTASATVEKGRSDSSIYEQDMAWLRESDMVIAECSTPSLGVGYELCYAERCGKPAHVFFNVSRGSLSAMLTGDSYFHIHLYSDEKELFAQLDAIL